jgi:hypothetical protein
MIRLSQLTPDQETAVITVLSQYHPVTVDRSASAPDLPSPEAPLPIVTGEVVTNKFSYKFARFSATQARDDRFFPLPEIPPASADGFIWPHAANQGLAVLDDDGRPLGNALGLLTLYRSNQGWQACLAGPALTRGQIEPR